MCLRVDKKIRNNHHREDGYCVAYKVVRKDNFSIFCGFSIFCPKEAFRYYVGENAPKDTPFAYLNQKYSEGNMVEYGLHLFLDKRIAKGLISWCIKHGLNDPGNMKIIKVFYKPEDVIAYGRSNAFLSFDNKEIEKSVVVRKLTIKSLDPIK